MFFIKRAWLYISRKLSKAIIVGIILFIVSTLVLIGLLINSASKNAYLVARNKLGATVVYNSDLSSIMQNNRSERPAPGTGGMTINRFELPDDYSPITTKEIEYIASNSKYVKNYVISASLAGKAIDFNYYNPNENNDNSGIGNGTIRINSANVNIVGTDIKLKDTTFHNDNITLVDGRYFSDEEITNANNVIIIEKTIADLNDIKVGDTITIERQKNIRLNDNNTTPSSDSNEISYEIVGIYKAANTTNIEKTSFMGSFNLVENTMYAPYTTVLSSNLVGLEGEELETAKAEIETNGYQVENVTFNLTDPSDTDNFINEVKNMSEVNTTYRSLNANDMAYKKMVGPIENVASTSKVLVSVVVIAGIFIIGLLSMLSIKDRKYELGVLLSLGEAKIKIIAQLITEMVLIGAIAIVFATIVGNFSAQGVTNYLLNQELATTETPLDTNDRRNNFPGGGFLRGNINQLSNIDVETIENLTVSLNSNDIVKVFGIGLIIIIVGNTLQAAFVLKCNPKEILLER